MSGLFLIMDDDRPAQSDPFALDCNVEFKEGFNIPVILDASGGKLSNILGMAKVQKFGNVLVYEAEFTDQSFVKMDPRLAKHFYPCACGKIMSRDKEGTITGFQITDIMISTANTDKRIPSLKCESV